MEMTRALQVVAVKPHVDDACSVGVQAELANASLYNDLLSETSSNSDFQAVFKQLQSASLNQHLPAFQRCAN
jgi:hypothetical protein